MHAKLATALSATALLVALLGTTSIGQAAERMILPSRSVGTAQLQTAAVTAAKVKNGTLTAAKFKAGQLPAGLPGAKGDTGDGPKDNRLARSRAKRLSVCLVRSRRACHWRRSGLASYPASAISQRSIRGSMVSRRFPRSVAAQQNLFAADAPA